MDTIEILGNLTKDPDVRATKTGGCMVRFTVGSNRKYQDRNTGEMKEVASFIPCIVWNELAESAANYLKKGKRVYIKGRWENRKYQDKNGQDKYITEIVVNFIALPLPVNYQKRGQGQPQKQQWNNGQNYGQQQSGSFGQFGQAKPEGNYQPQYPDQDIPF